LCCADGVTPASILFTAFHSALAAIKGGLLAKPNYQYEKRQRDLAKKLKKEEKSRQKLASKAAEEAGTDSSGAASSSAESTGATPGSETAPDA
jgi:hypothetical protein